MLNLEKNNKVIVFVYKKNSIGKNTKVKHVSYCLKPVNIPALYIFFY